MRVRVVMALCGMLAAQVMGQADRAVPRTDRNSQVAHEQLVEKAKKGGIDLYFLGDSITRRWGCSDAQYKDFLANWRENFYGWNAGNFGWGSDRVEHMLWRVENGELDGVNPKVIVILAGTNNLPKEGGDEKLVADVAGGIKRLVDVCREKAPGAMIVLTAVLPRDGGAVLKGTVDGINREIEKLADGTRVKWLNVNGNMTDGSGNLLPGVMSDGVHPTVKGYQIWADGLRPILTELLGPRGQTDHAPPSTGDPGIK